jgi:hypothetical protein
VLRDLTYSGSFKGLAFSLNVVLPPAWRATCSGKGDGVSPAGVSGIAPPGGPASSPGSGPQA